MPERNPAVFAAAGSVPIHESEPVNELAKNRVARPHAEERNRKPGVGKIRITSLHARFKIEANKIGSRNHCVWHHH